MQQAILQAQQAATTGEVPVGAVVVYQGSVIAACGNGVETLTDPTAHAEILALRQAAQRLGNPRLDECDLYVTLEPCPMCAGAIAHARIRRLYFGAYDPKGGGVDHGARVFDHTTCHHRPEIYGGLQEWDCANILQDFFQKLRLLKK